MTSHTNPTSTRTPTDTPPRASTRSRTLRFTRPRPRTRVAVAAAVCLLSIGAPTAYATLAEDASTGSVVAPARGTPYIETRLLTG